MDKIYNLDKTIFFNHYFKSRSKEQIARFISPYFLNIINKDVHFTLGDLLKDAETVPSYLLEDYPTDAKPNVEIESKLIKLI